MAITIAEARALFGPDAAGRSDEEIQAALDALHALAEELLDRQERGEL
jgi:hypothetical protein